MILVIKEGVNTEPVCYQEKGFLSPIPDGQGKFSPELIQKSHAFLYIKVKESFRGIKILLLHRKQFSRIVETSVESQSQRLPVKGQFGYSG
jgi:hypothetical protein